MVEWLNGLFDKLLRHLLRQFLGNLLDILDSGHSGLLHSFYLLLLLLRHFFYIFFDFGCTHSVPVVILLFSSLPPSLLRSMRITEFFSLTILAFKAEKLRKRLTSNRSHYIII
ncbi:unnamed protein product [Periconia digitata]|uniref:Uncharacterized protein n=1 Tax=Periconia digitata TaxID=1303443 RepID=A0A9W4UF20_9PLEO|nr:unnamed protein product [Periconia digitata]